MVPTPLIVAVVDEEVGFAIFMEPIVLQDEKLYPLPAVAEIGTTDPAVYVGFPAGVVDELDPPPIVAKET